MSPVLVPDLCKGEAIRAGWEEKEMFIPEDTIRKITSISKYRKWRNNHSLKNQLYFSRFEGKTRHTFGI